MLAIVFTIILALLSVFQLALALGAPLGRFAWGGKYRILPRKLRVASVFSILIYVLLSFIALSKVDVITAVSNQETLSVWMWVIAGYLVLGVALNAISRSKPERYVMTPVASVLAVLAILIALQAPGPVVNSFQGCKDAGGALLESYPEQCMLNGKSFTNPQQVVESDANAYMGLAEQDALTRASVENKPARVVERDGEALAVTMDFAQGRLNFYVKDGKVYKIQVEGTDE